jgi:hypothetical protein
VRILYVSYLPATGESASESAIARLFSAACQGHGSVERVKRIKNFAFVHFSTREAAEAALLAMQGATIDGCAIRIQWSKPPPPARANMPLETNSASERYSAPPAPLRAHIDHDRMPPSRIGPGSEHISPAPISAAPYLQSPYSPALPSGSPIARAHEVEPAELIHSYAQAAFSAHTESIFRIFEWQAAVALGFLPQGSPAPPLPPLFAQLAHSARGYSGRAGEVHRQSTSAEAHQSGRHASPGAEADYFQGLWQAPKSSSNGIGGSASSSASQYNEDSNSKFFLPSALPPMGLGHGTSFNESVLRHAQLSAAAVKNSSNWRESGDAVLAMGLGHGHNRIPLYEQHVPRR